VTLLAVFVALIFSYGLVSARLERTVLTAPILFTTAGMVVFLVFPALPERGKGIDVFLRLAEAGLVLLLFTDASRTDLKVLRSIRALPVRLLSTGLLLTLLLGTLVALVLFRQLSVFEAGILGAILAPTDAGLGQVIVNSPRVPLKIRQALNVEAGLNDGLSVPFLLFFIAMASNATVSQDVRLGRLILEQLGYGAAVGAGIGLAGGWLLGWARKRDWMSAAFVPLAVVALPLLCAVASEAAAASMFIAAFVTGLAVQIGFKETGQHSVEFTEGWGQFLNLSVFFLFGMLIARDWRDFTAMHLAYAVLSLTVVRMLPVAIALLGTGLHRTTVLFMGWFGPRGLASIVLALVYLEHAHPHPATGTIRSVVMVTVLLSILAHGLSAVPGIRLYAQKLPMLPSNAPEREPIW
jgi:NhaP-type Na+/H+ or K+/H+ antiporter